jgi:ankyrin repeat protein
VQQAQLNRVLLNAIKQGDLVKTKACLASGADANARDVPIDTRPAWAQLWDLVRGEPISTRDSPTALLVALQRKLDSNTPRARDTMALSNALLDGGAAINAKVINGSTVLYYAVDAHDASATQLLLQRGALVNVRNDDGQTPLHWAAYSGDTNMATFLLQNGADVNAPDLAGDTPLFTAALHGQAMFIRFLIDKGAQVNITDKADYTPLSLAQMNGDKQIVNILKEAGATK